MDETDHTNIQFIDFTNVDERDRNWILNSLQQSNPSVSGPWKQPRIKTSPAQKAVQINYNKQPEQIVKVEFVQTAANNNGSISGEIQPISNGSAGSDDGKPKSSWASLFNKPTSNGLNGSNAESTVNGVQIVPSIPVVKSTYLNHAMISENPEFDDPNYYRIGEFLSGHAINYHSVSLQPRGLVNRSNYCYINSILQALLACPPLYNLFIGLADSATINEKRKHTNVIDNMSKFVKEFNLLPAAARIDKSQKSQHLPTDAAFEPFWIYKMLNGIRNDTFLVEGRQEDAEEFLGCLLNGLNDEMLELIKLVKSPEEEPIQQQIETDKEWQVMGSKNKGYITRRTEVSHTPISDIFGGQLRSRVCKTGDNTTDNITPFFTLQLHIEKVGSVKEALEMLVSKNPLEGVISSKTNKEVEAWQQVTIEELPIVLVLHLKYFDYNLEGCTKIIKSIEFPIDLKIDLKLLSSKNNYTAADRHYRLCAVVYHDGRETTKGHYVTDTYHPGHASWLRYDDAVVRIIHEQNVLRPHGSRVPYLLFYQRVAAATN